MMKDMIEKKVVVRSRDSGVWHGKLVEIDANWVVLREARRAWNWTGAATCSGLATHGPKGGKIPAPVKLAAVGGWCEVLLEDDDATKRWESVEPWIA
jgi:hypothetical protein